jgi:hypothetical protein
LNAADSLSAAFKNLTEEQDFTVRYTALLDHYDMTVGAERILSHPADPILSQGGTQSQGRASVDKCRCLAV